MNHDEGQYHILTFMMNCCSIKSCRSENQLATPRHPLKISDRQDELSVIQVLIKETGVSETSITLK